MAQSVELLLDEALDSAVRHQWRDLADAGLPSQARHRGASNRPHVTLCVAPHPWPDDVESALAGTAGAAPLPLPLRLGGLVVFGGARGRFVLARLVVPSAALLRLQATLAADAGTALEHTMPGAWTPHVTLARAVTTEQFPAALAALTAPGVPAGSHEPVGSATALRRWDGDAKVERLLAQAPVR